MTEQNLPKFNNLMEQKLYTLQKTDELIAQLHAVKQAFDTPEEIERLTQLFNTAKEVIKNYPDIQKYRGSTTKDGLSATNEYRFYNDVAKFETVEAYIIDLKEKADTNIQTFIMFRKTMEQTNV